MDDNVGNEHGEHLDNTWDLSALQFDGVSTTRKQELQERFWAWMPSKTSKRPGPFEGERLDRLDVSWLLWQAWQRNDELMNTLPEGAPWESFPLPLVGVDLTDVDLKGIDLRGAHIEDAMLGRANLQDAVLSGAGLAGANLRNARLEKASLEGADLTGAVLAGAHLEGADLRGTCLIGADLSETYLEGANLSGAILKGADLRSASFDKKSKLNGVTLTDASLDQVLLDNTNLTLIDWERVRVIGEELTANEARGIVNIYDGWAPNLFDPPNVAKAQRPEVKYGLKPRADRAEEYAVASRTYRLLVNALRGQGLTRTADDYDYRAQEMRRKQLRYERCLLKYLTMTILAVMIGYGHRLKRIIATYIFVVAIFAILYLVFGHTPLTWQSARDALQMSLNAVHGRVIFVQFQLGTWPAWLETLESITGIGIEAVFVAGLIQKLFAR